MSQFELLISDSKTTKGLYVVVQLLLLMLEAFAVETIYTTSLCTAIVWTKKIYLFLYQTQFAGRSYHP